MKRRKFISQTSVFSAGISVLMGGMKLGILPRSPISLGMNADSDKVLVLIQLQGGNDGLNTVVPLEYFPQLQKHRGNLLPSENKLLRLNHYPLALHPALLGIKSLFDEGKLTIAHGVGYPNQNRSHFRSTDIWSSGSDAGTYDSRGWLGKYLDAQYINYPEGYPSALSPDPIAISMGAITSETCQGAAANFSLAVSDPFGLSPLTTGVQSMTSDDFYGKELDFVRQEIEKTNAYTEVITKAADLGASKVHYPDESSLATQLRNVATLISGGLQTRIYVCSLGGFDTHANQVVNGDPLTGTHAALLSELDGAITAFQEDLKRLGLEERVIGMTFSEFGRQIRSNESLGTDHGTAAPLFLFGACVQTDFYGEAPQILDEVAPQEGVAMQIDFRDIYGSVLQQWFGVEDTAIRDLLFTNFRPLPLLGNCQLTGSTSVFRELDFVVFPNPFREHFQVSIEGNQAINRVSIFDARGTEILVILDKKLARGKHTFDIDLRNFPSGNYFVHWKSDVGQATRSVVKIGK